MITSFYTLDDGTVMARDYFPDAYISVDRPATADEIAAMNPPTGE